MTASALPVPSSSRSFLQHLIPHRFDKTGAVIRLLRRAPIALFLLFVASTAFAQQVWIESFTGLVPPEKPQGYRYDINAHTVDIQIFFQNDFLAMVVDNRVFLNGGPDVAFSCSFNQSTGAGSCFATLPYSCGKVSVVVQQEIVGIPSLVTSNPVDIFVFNSPTCLPQCDSCQLTSTGQAAGRPINVATGKLWYTNSDLVLSGPFGLRFSRWYDNQAGNSGDLGVGWRHNYSAFLDLSQVTNRMVILHDEEDRRTYFTGLNSGGSVHDGLSGSDLALDSGGTTYTLTTWAGAKMMFDSAGRLISTADRIGNTQTIARDSGHSFRISSVTDPLGRIFTFNYDASNRITSVTTNLTALPGSALSMTYDTGTNCAGNLCSVTEPDGKTWTYQYDASHNLTKVLDPLSHAEEINTYSGTKCTSQSTEGGQNILNLTYGSGTTTVMDGLVPARSTTYTFDPKLLVVTNVSGGPGCGCGGGQSRSFAWDNFLRKASETDGDGSTHTVTWTYGRDVTISQFDGFTEVVQTYPSPTSRIEPLASATSRTTQWAYYALTDARRDLVQTETIPSADTSGQSKVTTNTFNTQGLLTSRAEQGRVGGVVTTYTTSFTYDSKGRLLTTDGPRTDVTDVTTNVYYPDTGSDFALRGQLNTVTDAVGNVTTFAGAASPNNTYDPFGHPRSVTDPNAVVRQMTYDARGRLLTSTLKGVTGDPADLTTTYGYDDSGKLTSVTLPSGNGTSYVYDGSNRLTDTMRFGADGKQYERLHLTYDAMSQKTQEDSQVCTTPAASCSSWTTPAAKTESFKYDTYGRLSEVDHAIPANSKIVYGYDAAGNLTSVQDENHSSGNTTYSYDYANRLISVTQTLTGAPATAGTCPAAAGKIATCYAYDVQDNLKSVTDPNSNVTTYGYDDFRRMKNQVSPVSGTTTYSYDAAGNLVKSVDARQAPNPSTDGTTRTYDAVNRVLTATAVLTGQTAETVSWTYDDAMAGNYGKGRLKKMTDPSGSTTYTYERRGLLNSDVRTILGASYTLGYAYNANGNRISVTYPSTRVLSYAFDFADRPLSASWSGATFVSAASYAPFGPETSLTFGNGTTKTTTYDQRYRPMENKLVKTSPLTTLADYTYGEDSLGNVTSITDAVNSGFNRTFTYDDLNRLVTANSGSALWGSGSYGYDSMGNLKTLTLGGSQRETFSYVGTTPKLSSVLKNGVTRSVVYDAAGNETTVGAGVETYSPRNYFSSAAGNTYTYDGRGLRTAVSVLAPVVGQNSVWLMNGTSLSSIVDLPALPNTDYRMEGSGDFNADGKPDLIFRNALTGSNSVWLMNGTSLLSIVDLPALTNTDYRIEGTGDFNSDGKPDIVLRNYATGSNAVWLMNGTTFLSVVDLPALPNTDYRIDGIGDFNADGKPDIVLRNYAAGQNAVWLMNGTSLSMIVDLPALTNTNYRIEGVGDFNADLKPDIVLRNYVTGQDAVWLMNGTSLLSIVDLPALTNTSYRIEAIGDFNGDGKADIVLRNYGTEQSAPLRVRGGIGLSLAPTPDREREPILRLASLGFGKGLGLGSGISLDRERLAWGLDFGFVDLSERPLRASPVGEKATTFTNPTRLFFYSPEMSLLAETELTTNSTPVVLYEYVWFNGHPVAQVDSGTTVHWTFTDHLGTPLIQTDSGGSVYWRGEYEAYGRISSLRTNDQHQPLRLPGRAAQSGNERRHRTFVQHL